MSFKFDGTTQELEGDFATTYAMNPAAIWAFVKIATPPPAVNSIIQLGAADGSGNNSIEMRCHSVLNQYAARVLNSLGGNGIAVSGTIDISAIWVPIVCEFLSATSRTIRIGDYSTNTGTNATDRSIGNMQHIKCGRSFTNGNSWGSANPNEDRLAEIAVLTGAIPSQAETELYMVNQRRPSAITFASAVMSLYISMETNTLENTGADADGDLVSNGATFDADHPAMTVGGAHAYPLYGKFGGLLRGKLG